MDSFWVITRYADRVMRASPPMLLFDSTRADFLANLAVFVDRYCPCTSQGVNQKRLQLPSAWA